MRVLSDSTELTLDLRKRKRKGFAPSSGKTE